MKIPNFASSYHDGSGLESSDFQFASYLACTLENWFTNKSKVVTKVNILQPEKYKSKFEEHGNKMRANKLITRLTLTSENKRFNLHANVHISQSELSREVLITTWQRERTLGTRLHGDTKREQGSNSSKFLFLKVQLEMLFCE